MEDMNDREPETTLYDDLKPLSHNADTDRD